MTMNNNNSKTRKKAGVNPVPLCSHVLHSNIFLKTYNIMITTGKKFLKDGFFCYLQRIYHLFVIVSLPLPIYLGSCYVSSIFSSACLSVYL